jgi:copper/silver efflux system protein
MTPSGAQIPLGEIAKVDLSPGPSMIRDEDARLTGYVYIDLATSDYGSYVARAQHVLEEKLQLPPGYTLKWSGEYEFQLRAKKRLSYIMPVVFGVIFVLLYMLFHSVIEAAVLIFPCLYAMTGGTVASVSDGLQLQRSGMGRLHRALWNRRRDRRCDE